MSKQRITKEMIVEVAFQLAREGGFDKMIVKNIASKLKCSVQPIYSYCSNMDGLKKDVLLVNNQFIQKYLAEKIIPEDFFRSTGYAYVQLAKEEPYLFQLFISQQRDNISSLSDLYTTQTDPKIAKFISQKMNISEERAKELHLNMLIYTVGIGTILSNCKPGISEEEILCQLEKAFTCFSKSINNDS